MKFFPKAGEKGINFWEIGGKVTNLVSTTKRRSSEILADRKRNFFEKGKIVETFNGV